MRFKALNQNGSALMVVVLIVVVFGMTIVGISRAGIYALHSEGNHYERTQAFYLAEAAVAAGKAALLQTAGYMPVPGSDVETALNDGSFMFTADATEVTGKRRIVGRGVMPGFNNPAHARSIEVIVEQSIEDFPTTFETAIFASNDLTINGNSNDVDGDVLVGNAMTCNPGPHACAGITGDTTVEGDEDYPLVNIPLEQLKAIAKAQGNYHDSEPDESELPDSFYYTEPTEGEPGVPNIVFIEDDLSLNGNSTVGGFIIIVDDYMTDPTSQGDVSLNGSGTIEGFIFASNDITENGGGQPLNVNGGLLAWNNIMINGHADVAFSQEYADALANIEVRQLDFQTVSWNEIPFEDIEE